MIRLGCNECGFSFMLNGTKRGLKSWYYCPLCGNEVRTEKNISLKPNKPKNLPKVESHSWG